MSLAAALTARFDALLRLRPATGDRFAREGAAVMAAALAPAIAAGRPVRFVLPGFPFKNPAACLGALPDRAEAIALARLDAFRAAADQIHPCEVILFADGRVWGDLLDVSRERQLAYHAGLRAMAPPGLRFADLDTVGLRDAAHLMDAFPAPVTDAAVGARFEALAARDGRGHVAAMRARHAAFGRLIAHHFPDAVRLSVHADDGAGPKFGVALLPGGALPYHCVAVEQADGALEFLTLAEAQALPGALETIFHAGAPWCLRRHAPREVAS